MCWSGRSQRGTRSKAIIGAGQFRGSWEGSSVDDLTEKSVNPFNSDERGGEEEGERGWRVAGEVSRQLHHLFGEGEVKVHTEFGSLRVGHMTMK